MEIHTGHTGKAHITAVDDATSHIALYGGEDWVFDVGDKFGYDIVSNNQIDVKSGYLMMQGRYGQIPRNKKDSCVIENGAQTQIRHDIIACRYERDISGVEKMSTIVLKGTPGSAGTDPKLEVGDINASASKYDMPLYRVVLNGINIEKVEPLFKVFPQMRRVRVGAALPADASEGDIFLLLKK